MSKQCPECVASRPVASRPPTSEPVPSAAPVACKKSHRSAGLAAALTVVPGLGHAYAGAFGRAFLGFFVGAPVLVVLTATETVAPGGALGLLGLFALDAYRVARARNGEWTARRSADLRSAMIALVVAVSSVAIAREAGLHAKPTLAIPVFMVLFGVALAWPARTPKPRTITPIVTTPPVVPPAEPASVRVLVPGETLDRRLSRSELAATFAAGQFVRPRPPIS